jgi:UDP-N-acetylmuramoyl-tripeptide--D-alanyl-D-alanine ligase
VADFTLKELIDATGGMLIQGDLGRKISGIAIDSRKLKPGELFIAIKGEHFDGHSFITEAANAGAAAAIVMEDSICDIPVIKVDNTLTALGAIAGYHRNRFSIPVIGITGSNGKTTTKDLLAAILSEQFTVIKTEANFNNEIGLPLTLLKITGATDVAVVEMGMRGPGQIKQLTEVAQPTIGIVTNVGLTHLELLGTQENIAKAKAELIESLGEDGLAVLNGDDPMVRNMSSFTKAGSVYYGIDGPKLDYRANGIKLIENGSLFKVTVKKDPRGELELRISIPGRHNVLNSLAAVAVAKELKVENVHIRKGLMKPEITEKRLNIFKRNGYAVIDDTYNASPTSVKAALDVLKSDQNGWRKIAVLADMLELGSASGEIHREIGEYAGKIGVDRLFGYGEFAREYIVGVNRISEDKGSYFLSKQELIMELKKFIAPGDTILVKGSRGMKMEEIVAAILEEGNEA